MYVTSNVQDFSVNVLLIFPVKCSSETSYFTAEKHKQIIKNNEKTNWSINPLLLHNNIKYLGYTCNIKVPCDRLHIWNLCLKCLLKINHSQRFLRGTLTLIKLAKWESSFSWPFAQFQGTQNLQTKIYRKK